MICQRRPFQVLWTGLHSLRLRFHVFIPAVFIPARVYTSCVQKVDVTLRWALDWGFQQHVGSCPCDTTKELD